MPGRLRGWPAENASNHPMSSVMLQRWRWTRSR